MSKHFWHNFPFLLIWITVVCDSGEGERFLSKYLFLPKILYVDISDSNVYNTQVFFIEFVYLI